jgi:hypothetical protein
LKKKKKFKFELKFHKNNNEFEYFMFNVPITEGLQENKVFIVFIFRINDLIEPTFRTNNFNIKPKMQYLKREKI